MIRRRAKAEKLFTERRNPLPTEVSGTELNGLKSIASGGFSNARMRARLTSRGLATSPIGSKCRLTRLGAVTLSAGAS
jgi:hypothetical protein